MYACGTSREILREESEDVARSLHALSLRPRRIRRPRRRGSSPRPDGPHAANKTKSPTFGTSACRILRSQLRRRNNLVGDAAW